MRFSERPGVLLRKPTTAIAAALLIASVSAVSAQTMDYVPKPKDDLESACRVEGLKLSGDGFLSVRSGPGVRYRKVGEVYNGDEIIMKRPCAGPTWCFADAIVRVNGAPAALQGWFSTAWCRVFAG